MLFPLDLKFPPYWSIWKDIIITSTIKRYKQHRVRGKMPTYSKGISLPSKNRDPGNSAGRRRQGATDTTPHRGGRDVFCNAGLRSSKAAYKVLESLCLYNWHCPSFGMKGNMKKIEIKIHYFWKYRRGVVLFKKKKKNLVGAHLYFCRTLILYVLLVHDESMLLSQRFSFWTFVTD